MKKSIFDQGQPKGDMMLAALKQAVANLKAANDSSALTDKSAAAKETAQTPVNPLKLNQVEEKLGAADLKYLKKDNQSNAADPVFGPPPRLNQLQQNEDYYRQEQKRIQALEDGKKQDAFERNLRNVFYGEPLAKKPVPMDKGVYDLGDAWRNPSYTGGALAKNGARTRGYTDTASDVGAPVRFWSGTDEDKKRQYTEAISRGAETEQEFHDYLVSAHIDIFNATPEQKEIIDMVGKELMKKSVLDTLTIEDKVQTFENTLKYLYSHTKSANGDPYPIYIDIAKSHNNSERIFQEQKAMKDSSMSDSELKRIFEYGRQPSGDEKTTETNSKKMEYKNQIYLEEMERYKEDLQKGRAKVGDIQKYYDKALEKIYETCFTPIPVKNTKGNVVGSVAIGDLIAPYDDSFGAKIATNALDKLGTPYNDMDCEQLIKWAVAQENSEWGKHGIGSNAYYQSLRTDPEWKAKNDSDQVPSTYLHTGDLLYWKNNQNEIVHTAIYLGNGYMVESAGTVKVTQLRERTDYGNGEYSYLAQVNELDEGTLQKNVEEYKKYH